MRETEEPSPFAAKSPSFFKIVLDSALRDGKIGIPKAFVMKHGKCLAESVLLKVPSGAEWRIGLTRCDGEVWLEKGWPEFAKFYSLDHGYLLVFSCEGDYASFQVQIFSRNTMEIDYPMNSSLGEGEELEDDDVSVEILDVVPSKKRGRRELASLWPHKTMRTKSGDEAEVNSYSRGKTKDQGVKHQREKRSYGTPSSLKNCQAEGGSMPTASTSLEANEHDDDTRDGAFLRATSFEYSNPHLVVRMQKSYLSRYLKLQGAFAKECVCARGVRIVNLQNSAGRTWPAMFTVEVWNEGKRRQGRVSWKSFVHDNHLKVGDACVFELKKGCEVPTFKVHIFRAEDADA
ncbi:B3 domain-containing transcription factor VRN1-like [Rosa sericea]